jgi:phenylalanyl-tRNA synthetase beta chain
MYLSLNWLLEFTPYSGSVDELSHTLTMLGLEVDEEYEAFRSLRDFRVGRVLSCSPHPNADNLTLCRVDLGGEQPADIVCGAPNVTSGQNVPVAPAGTALPSGTRVDRTKIRGRSSEGMILSASELGLGEDESGIMVLSPGLAPGTPLREALGISDHIFDIDITPNRGDCLSILGIAREVAAVHGLPLHPPRTDLEEAPPACADNVDVSVDDGGLCPLYQARVAEGLSPEASPEWLRHRLLAMGQRPINTIVDVTNYVMLETGQPLHAFDLDRLAGPAIRVGPPDFETPFTTLDGTTREVGPKDLLIWDAERPIALAGVMGGLDTEIGPGSSRLLLESAVFDPTTIRKTGRRLGLSSESAYRFERGVDQLGSAMALDRAAHLLQRLSGAKVWQGVSRCEPAPWRPERIQFRPGRARSLLAVDATDAFCLNTLRGLGCEVEDGRGEGWTVSTPSHRHDLLREVDLVEEVARVYGYERIPEDLPRVAKSLRWSGEASDKADDAFQKTVRHWAKGIGLQEVMSYSFVSSADLDALNLPADSRLELANPLTSEQDTMRPVLAPGLLLNIRSNVDRNSEDLRIFEVARAFELDRSQETTSLETTLLGIALHGSRNPRGWPRSGEVADFLDLKGLVQNLLSTLHLGPEEWETQAEHPYLDPCASITVGREHVGWAGELTAEASRRYHARHPVWIAELNLDRLQSLHRSVAVTYTPWSRYPPVFRDMTLVAGPDLEFKSIRDQIEAARSSLLDSFMLLDIYQPEDGDNRNITLRMVYRHPERTLVAEEVDREHGKLGDRLCSALPLRFP